MAKNISCVRTRKDGLGWSMWKPPVLKYIFIKNIYMFLDQHKNRALTINASPATRNGLIGKATVNWPPATNGAIIPDLFAIPCIKALLVTNNQHNVNMLDHSSIHSSVSKIYIYINIQISTHTCILKLNSLYGKFTSNTIIWSLTQQKSSNCNMLCLQCF